MYELSISHYQSDSLKDAIAEVLPLVEADSRYPVVFLDGSVAIAFLSNARLEKPHDTHIPDRIALSSYDAAVLIDPSVTITGIAKFEQDVNFTFADGSVLTVVPMPIDTYSQYPEQSRLESVLFNNNLFSPVSESFRKSVAEALKASGNRGKIVVGQGEITAYDHYNYERLRSAFDDPSDTFETPIELGAEQLRLALKHMTAATVWENGQGISFTDGGVRGSLKSSERVRELVA